MMKQGASGTQMEINTSRPLMWHPRGKEGGMPSVNQDFVFAGVCVSGAGCPLLSKQQKCHPLPCDWCGRWRFYLIQGLDSKTGAMLLSLLFLPQLEDVQLPGADTRGQCAATESAVKQTANVGGGDED